MLTRQRIGRMLSYPGLARTEANADRRWVPDTDPGADRVVELGIQWLGFAQEQSASQDGGVARHYSPLGGWAPSYPETSGYIVPTLLEYARVSGESYAKQRARRILDWLAGIQLHGGGYQGGTVASRPVVPVVFNTGQILLGLASGVQEFGDYGDNLLKAADWLVVNQDTDGCWRRHPSPFAGRGEKAYDTHVAWGLLEAAKLVPGRGYAEAALANIAWALSKQRTNGWVEQCCLSDAKRPLTHTLGYFLRGVLEGYRYAADAALLAAARRTADGLLSALGPDGSLPGRLLDDWVPAVDWVCLTGSAQIAHCWLLLFQYTGECRYLDAALCVNRFIRSTIRTTGPAETRGAVKGAWPVDGDYGRFQYLNWAVKFSIDANRLQTAVESELRS